MKPTNQTILFADVCDSTGLYERHGDSNAKHAVDRCLAQISGIVSEYHGRVIKEIGDEIMCSFGNPAEAIDAACAMQRRVSSPGNHLPGMPALRLRIGLQYGDVIAQDGDLFGDAVNVASRIAAMARADKIYTSAAILPQLNEERLEKLREIENATFKGKQESTTIFEVIWQQGEELDDLTIVDSSMDISLYVRLSLLLEYRGRTIQLDAENPSIILGRRPELPLQVLQPKTSREHARVEFSGGVFTLTDQSTNGTFVQQGILGEDGQFVPDEDPVNLKRNPLALRGQGRIGLGVPPEALGDDVVYYSLQAEAY